MLIQARLILTSICVLLLLQSEAQIGNYSVQLDVASPEGTHNTLVYFEDSLTWTTDVPTFGWDGCCDALFIPGSTPVSFLYTEIIEPDFPVNNQISINGLPPLTGSYSVPVNLIVGTSGAHTIVASPDQIPSGMTVELQDLAQGVIQDLLVSNTYFFDGAIGDDVGRFILHFNMNLVDVVFESDENWKVIPTLAMDVVRIEGMNKGKFASIELYSLSGKLLRTAETGHNSNFSLVGLTSGIYLIRMRNESHTRTFRIVKQ